MIIYHGGTEIVDAPRIFPTFTGRDFGMGFYTTDIRDQAMKWAERQARIRNKPGAFLNTYEFDDSALQILKVKDFGDYSMEWLDLVIECRRNFSFRHEYDIVIGKIANDNVGETIQAVVEGLSSKDFALTKLVFMPANNQICFSTNNALKYLNFKSAEKVN
jgi:hypothetical protein